MGVQECVLESRLVRHKAQRSVSIDGDGFLVMNKRLRMIGYMERLRRRPLYSSHNSFVGSGLCHCGFQAVVAVLDEVSRCR